MKDLKRSTRVLKSTLNTAFWIMLAGGVFAAGYHIHELYRLFTDPTTLSGEMVLTIDYLTIRSAESFGMGLDAAASLRLVYLISSAAITVAACLGIKALKRVLLPIENGQPFLEGISADILALGKCAFRLGLIENLSMLATVILLERHAVLDVLLDSGAVTGIAVDPSFRPAWFIVAALLSVLAMVFRQGEQLQTLSDETL